MANRSAEFPATLEIDYPDRELNRLTTFFQPFTVIPIAIILALITRATLRAGSANYLVGSGGIVSCSAGGSGWRPTRSCSRPIVIHRSPPRPDGGCHGADQNRPFRSGRRLERLAYRFEQCVESAARNGAHLAG